MANLPAPSNVRSKASGKLYVVAVHTAGGGYVADVLQGGHLVAKTKVHRTPNAAEAAGTELAHTV